MNLYLVHCGFYDPSICDGIYESHVNLFAAADSFESARAEIRKNPFFQKMRMHVDGMEEIQIVNGARVCLEVDPTLGGQTLTQSRRHRDL